MSKRTKWIAGVCILLAVAGGAYAFTRPSVPLAPVTDVVRRGDLRQTVEATGTVRALGDANLSFQTSGMVNAVFVSVGDAVAAGETLAMLDVSELEAAYAKARTAVVRAETDIALLSAGSTGEAVAEAEAGVAVAEAALAAARSDAERVATVNSGAEADAEASAVTARANLADAVRPVVAEVRHALSVADRVLGIENSLYNREFRSVLGNEDSVSLTDATNAFLAAQKTRDAAELSLSTMDETDEASVVSVAVAASAAYADAYATLLATARVLDGTSADSVELSLEDLTAFKASVSSELSVLIADGSALSAARRSLDDARRAADDATQARAERARSLASAQSAVVSREADLARAKASLASLTAVPREADLAPLEASLDGARSDADAARVRLEKALLVSPIDGIVTEVALDAGEFASAGVSAVTVLSTGQDYEIAVDIPEADVAKTYVGAHADVSFDALGDDRSFAGTVTRVDPAQKLIEGVVFYETRVILAAADGLDAVKPGMSANVTVLAAERSGALYVPSRAVLEKNGAKYVRVLRATEQDPAAFEERTVATGLRADGGFVEIIDGLSEGETVVISMK